MSDQIAAGVAAGAAVVLCCCAVRCTSPAKGTGTAAITEEADSLAALVAEAPPTHADDSGEDGQRAAAASPNISLAPEARAELDSIDALIDKLDITAAAARLEHLVLTLKSPDTLNDCIQALDVLGQCYLYLRDVSRSLDTYEKLLNVVEGDVSISDSRMYSAAYAIRGALHEDLKKPGYAVKRDADFTRAVEAGCPESYGRQMVDDFISRNALYRQHCTTGVIPTEWSQHRQQYKVAHKVGEATQLMMLGRFEDAAALMDAELAALELTFQESSVETKASHAAMIAFKGVRAQAKIGLCELEEALADLSAVTEAATAVKPAAKAPTGMDAAQEDEIASFAEGYLLRGSLRHFLCQEGARDDWQAAVNLMPELDVAQQVDSVLGQWVMLESWGKLPRAQRMKAVQQGTEAVAVGDLAVALHHFENAIEFEQSTKDVSGEIPTAHAMVKLKIQQAALLKLLGRDSDSLSVISQGEDMLLAHDDEPVKMVEEVVLQMCTSSEATFAAAVPAVRAFVKKHEGNAAVRQEAWNEAIQCYSDAIELVGPTGPQAHTYYSNRSMCHERLGDWAASEADARATIAASPTFEKGYIRLIKAMKEGNRYQVEDIGNMIDVAKAAVASEHSLMKQLSVMYPSLAQL